MGYSVIEEEDEKYIFLSHFLECFKPFCFFTSVLTQFLHCMYMISFNFMNCVHFQSAYCINLSFYYINNLLFLFLFLLRLNFLWDQSKLFGI
jgi:hypothetical protein